MNQMGYTEDFFERLIGDDNLLRKSEDTFR